MTEELMKLTRSAEIEQKLAELKQQIEEQTKFALSLEVNEDTVKEVKKVMADLNKSYAEVENGRKELKKAVMAPYEAFEVIYKANVTDVFKPAINQLKEKVAEVENGLIVQKTDETKKYFDEYQTSIGLQGFVFGDFGIKVNLSTSVKKLKEQCKECLDKLKSDIDWINNQEFSEEIYAEYLGCLDAIKASTRVTERHKAQKAAAEALERNAEKARQIEAAEEKVEEAVQEIAEKDEELSAPMPVEEEPIYEVTFTVRGTKEQIIRLKEYLKKEGLKD